MPRRAYATTLRSTMLIVAFFLAEIVRRPVARPIFNFPSVNSLSFLYFWTIPEAGFTSHARGRLSTFHHPFPCRQSPCFVFPDLEHLLNSTSLSSCAEHALFIHFLFCNLSPLFKILWPELLHGPMDGCQEFSRMLYLIICWYDFIFGTSLG